jgi:hypothetical protein
MKTKPKRRVVWIGCTDRIINGTNQRTKEACEFYCNKWTAFKDATPTRFVEAPKARRKRG